MKIVAISDTHSRHSEIVLPDGDVLVHLGDHVTGWDEMIDDKMRYSRDWLMSHRDNYKLIISLVGNHDPFSAPSILKEAEGIHYLHDDCITIDGITFSGTPWCKNTYGRFTMSEREIEKHLMLLGTPDILLSHSPPLGILDTSSFGMSVGSSAILKFVKKYRPIYHIFGHCHNTAGESVEIDGTTFINASAPKEETPEKGGPIVIEISMEQRKR
jgi:Icc-related predicted phosphoesterase